MKKSPIIPTDVRYDSIVSVENARQYQILTNNINNGDSIICPFDKSMTVGKTDSGQIILTKKSRYHAFIK
jgi:hypothetical protein